MTFTFDELKLARERGYSDDEIWNTLASEDKEISLAKQRGYSLEEVASITSGQPIPEEEPSGFLRQAADIPIQFAKGIGTGTRGFTDIIGADNPVSKMIAGYEDYMDTLLSAESRNDSKRVAQMLQDAKDGGFLDKISAGFEAFASAPLETTANVAGYMVPQLAIGLVGKAAMLTKAGAAAGFAQNVGIAGKVASLTEKGKKAQTGLTLGTGFVQGVGTAKGNIYQNTKEYLREQGVPEDQIEDIAVKAQSYNGENLDQLLLSGGLNALAASTGAEAILTRVLAKEGKEVSGGIIGGILKGAGAEGSFESVQSAQEEVTKNIPLQRLGYDVPTFQGAIESATTGLFAGGFVGGLAGGVEALSPEQKEQREIDKEAERRARELEASNPAAQALSTEITRLERGIDNKRMDLDALESTSPEASKMRLDIAADQKKLAVLKEQANNFGLSEPITEAERQQIELAKQIAAPPEEKPAKLPTMPSIEEQEAGVTYGGETGLYDVFSGARRKPVVTEEPPVSMVGKQVIPGVTPVPVVAKAPTEPTVKESLTVAPVEEEPFGKLPTAEAETALSQRTKEATIAEEREKIEAPIRRQESINQFLSEGATIKSRTNVVGRKKAAEGGGDITKTAYYLAHPDGKREIPLSKKEASDLETPAITPTPVAETPAVVPAPKVAPIQRDVTKPEQMTPKEFRSETLFAKKARQAAKIWGKLGSLYDRLGRELTSNVFSTDNLADPSAYSGPTTMAEIANLTEDDMLNYAKAVTLIKWAEGDVAGEFRERSGSYKELIDSEADRIRKEIELYKDIPVQERTDESDSEIKKRVEEEIDDVAFAAGIRQENERNIIRSLKYAGEINKIKEDLVRLGIPVFYNKTEYVVPEIDAPSWDDHVKEIKKARIQKKPISAAAVDKYDITLPEGYTKQGDLYVYQPAPAVSETITPVEPEGKAEAIKFADEALRERDKEVGRYKKKADAERNAGREEMAQIYEGMINDLMSVPANEFKQDVIENPAYYIESNVDPFLRFKNKEVNRAVSTTEPEGISVGNRIKLGKSPQTYIVEEAIPQTEAEKANNEQFYSVKNERTGETQVVEQADMKKVGGKRVRKMAVEVIPKQESVTPIPEANRYTFEEAVKAVDAHFGKKGIPEGVVIVNNTTEPDLEMKAGYFVNRGQIVINLAYIAKGENLGDIIDHELGHYIFGDPKFQADFKKFWELMTPEEKAKADQIINQFYNKETGAVQMEEKQVRAFMQLIQDSKAMPKWKQLLDKIKRWINEKLGTNLQVNDRGALAVLAAAYKRFKSGEQIVREIDSGVLKTAETAQDAEYLAAVERGDMETAQRMVDEAAKKAGYGVKGFHGTDARFTVFDSKFRNKTPFAFDDHGLGFFFSNNKSFVKKFGDIQMPVYLKMGDSYETTYDEYIKELKDIGQRAGESIREDLKRDGYQSINIIGYNPATTIQAVFDPEQIKSADPVTYDDAGDVIPLSQRFQPSEPDIRRMAVEPTGERQQIMGEKIGPLKKTPEGIIAETQAKLRERFDPTKVTEQNTTEAFRALGRLTGKDGTAFAQELNDIGRMVDESGAAAEVSMGAALFVNDLFEYAVRLAAQGQKMMLGIMMTNINRLPTGTEGRSDAGRALRAAREMKDTFLTMAKAEQDAFINYAAEFVYGPNPTKQQVDSIKIGYDAVEKVQEPTAKEVEEEIAAVGEKTGTDLVGRINEEFTKATEKGKAKRKTESEDLDAEYKKVQMKAESEIEKLAKIQSDTPAFARQVVNEIRAIIANDLKQRPNMESKAQWKSTLVDKLQNAGVEPSRAERLADLVWRQHEINSLSREIDSINKAVEKGPISEIIKAIKETPLEQQQNPNWRYEVMRDYLRKAGLSMAQSERIAKLMDISLQKRFTQAKEQAFTDAISKTAPWKAGDVRSKRAFQQVLQAIRAGALDPSRNMASDIAAMNGWTGFTADQYKNLLKFDAILADEKTGELEKANAYKGVQDIISKSKLPIRARDVIAQYYDAQALNGIPTLSVNSFSPIAFAMRNAIVEAGSGTIKGDAKAIGRAATEFVDSIKSWANTVAFSFKNNVTVYSNVDYIVNDDNLLRLYRKGVDQFTKSKNAKERADGVKNMMIGMMDYVRRILNALDYGAIAALQNQNISKYAMAVMKNKGMNNKQANEVFAAMMKAKNDFYLQQIAIGTDKNKARILADEFYISSWKKSLEKEGVKEEAIKSAMDAAINDALSSVGRNRQSLDAFKEEATNIKDAGLASSPALWLLESVANAANRSDSQFIKIFSRVIYGFAIVPARVIRETAWFSPYGFVRLAVDAALKKRNIESRYAQSLGSDFQRQQRLNEAIAGTVALFGLMALRAGSTDDPEDEDAFKIVFTGNGPQRKDDPQFYDSWYKAGNRPNQMSVYFGKTKFAFNMMRGFEAFTWPAMMLGALDDLEIRKKQKQQTKTPAQLEDAAIVAGFVFDAALRRGPYAFTTKSLFGTYGDIGVEGVAKGLTFPAKTLIPVLGTSLASNLSNFLNDPIDRRTLDGAVWSNIPFIGPAVAPKSLNAFGEPSLSTDLASKMFKLGVPIVYDIPTDRESIKLHELVLKQGGGPSIPTRNQLAQRLDRQPTNKEYEMFVKEYGALIKEDMKLNFEELSGATPELYSKYVERIGLVARDIAETRVREKFEKP